MTGVVGRTRPRFHVYGPAVLKAEKMEQTGQEGRIHCSPEAEAAYTASEFGFYPATATARTHSGAVSVQTMVAQDIPLLPSPRRHHRFGGSVPQKTAMMRVSSTTTTPGTVQSTGITPTAATVVAAAAAALSTPTTMSPFALPDDTVVQNTYAQEPQLLPSAQADTSQPIPCIDGNAGPQSCAQSLALGGSDIFAAGGNSNGQGTIGSSPTVNLARVTSVRSLRATLPPPLQNRVSEAWMGSVSHSSGSVPSDNLPTYGESVQPNVIAAPSTQISHLDPLLTEGLLPAVSSGYPNSAGFQQRAGSSARQLQNEFEVAATFDE